MIDLRARHAQVTSSNHVQRFANMFGRGFGGQRLSTARGTEEVDNEPLTLSLNEIVKSKILVVGLHKGLEQLLSSRGKHKIRERFVVPLDVGDFLDVELDYRDRSEWVRDEAGGKLTPHLVSKTEAINNGRGDQYVFIFELAFLHFALSGDIKGGNI